MARFCLEMDHAKLNQISNQNYFINTKYTSSKSENSSTFGDTLNTFTLKIHDEKGNKALTSKWRFSKRFKLLAYSLHNDKIGKTSSVLRDFLSASTGVRNDNFYTFNDIERKID